MSTMSGGDFLEWVARQLVHDLGPHAEIRSLTKNTAILGAYAEATVRKLIAQVVSPLHVCTGTAVNEKLCSDPTLPQVDGIIWQACPVPALLQAENFGIVPTSSVFGIVEVKGSCYYGGIKTAKKTVERAHELVNEEVNKCAKLTLADRPHTRCVPGLAVFCMLLPGQQITDELQQMRDSGTAVVLLEQSADNTVKANEADVLRLLNFLMHVRRIARDSDGFFGAECRGALSL